MTLGGKPGWMGRQSGPEFIKKKFAQLCMKFILLINVRIMFNSRISTT